MTDARAGKRARPSEHAPVKVPLEGGATLLLEEDHSLPLVSISLALRTGAAHDAEGKEGATRLAMRMLRRGAGALGSKEIEDAIDRLGAEVGADVGTSTCSIEAQVIRSNLAPFTELLATLLGSPTFADDELGRLKRETVAELVEARDNDRALAQRAFRRAMFPGHLYARGAGGTVSSVPRLGRDDAFAAHALHLRRGNAVIGLSGDVDLDAARRVADRLAAALHAGPGAGDPIPEPEPVRGRRLVFVDKPDRTQTQILIGTLGSSAFDADHVALGVANSVFGGTFTSRLMREVRSKRGWSYGASSRLGVDRHRQAFVMWTFPAAGDAPACIELELGLLGAFVDKGISAKELSFVRSYLTRSRAFDVDTANKRLHQSIDVEAMGLPADYHTGYVDKVKAVTVEQANAAVRSRIAPDDALVVVVGTASTLLDPVKAAIGGLGGDTVVPFDAE